jgi:anthranilate synthase/aminodeoxychorismate synthase-like glutamine amidotransferase
MVMRNDSATVDNILSDSRIKAIIISPGPMTPNEAGISCDLIRPAMSKGIPILGICLGHQCIGKVFGCKIAIHPVPTHGKTSRIELSSSPLFENLPLSIDAGRYHSLYISSDSFNNNDLKIIAHHQDGTIMGIQHRTQPIFGVQFHPESVLTGDNGKVILNNFARIAGLL